MSIGMILKFISALATTVTGLLAVVKPAAFYGFTGLTTPSPQRKDTFHRFHHGEIAANQTVFFNI